MHRTAPRPLVAVALALVAVGCHPPPAAAPSPQAEIALAIENQNFHDMDVFIVRAGQRVRVGMVPGLSSRILMVRPDLVGSSTTLQFEVHPIGSNAHALSETVTVHPGDVIRLTIPPT